jgi:hypothetical protein
VQGSIIVAFHFTTARLWLVTAWRVFVGFLIPPTYMAGFIAYGVAFVVWRGELPRVIAGYVHCFGPFILTPPFYSKRQMASITFFPHSVKILLANISAARV